MHVSHYIEAQSLVPNITMTHIEDQGVLMRQLHVQACYLGLVHKVLFVSCKLHLSRSHMKHLLFLVYVLKMNYAKCFRTPVWNAGCRKMVFRFGFSKAHQNHLLDSQCRIHSR